MGDWTALFATVAGAAAALTGLVFVALSINLARILQYPALVGRAGEALILLVQPVFVSLIMIWPESGTGFRGVAVLALGLLTCAIVTRLISKAREAARARPAYEYRQRVAMAVLATAATPIAGGLLIGQSASAYGVAAAGTLLCIAAGIGTAWILLVEIVR